MYHAHNDATLLDAVYYNFQRRDLFHRVSPGHGNDLTMKVEEALLNSMGHRPPPHPGGSAEEEEPEAEAGAATSAA